MYERQLRLFALQLAALLTLFTASLAIPLHADVALPALLADHMVIQRGLPVHVWGTAAPHEAVSATFRNETKSGTADADGRWSISLSPGEAGGPFELSIKATNRIVLGTFSSAMSGSLPASRTWNFR